ncbi:hypothetical protein ASPBRDRAFT_39936 [Aspergillus brasiliensis CBS 101740]|uniref:Uncharacterized protein n=1 Tax=Aspergillus brasiliensis (strain CBS 101740 / IMI 381727 / IBT 21946) TaxID=767769 RepID=A0A1L9USY1_ASPBC|nr:hypothetical protein ASPBRDRAFT_39936 [Aspergillus brasiliensis CBS 101740]
MDRYPSAPGTSTYVYLDSAFSASAHRRAELPSRPWVHPGDVLKRAYVCIWKGQTTLRDREVRGKRALGECWVTSSLGKSEVAHYKMLRDSWETSVMCRNQWMAVCMLVRMRAGPCL